MLAIVSHHIIGGNECRHISTGLFGQEIINFPIISFTSGTADCFVYSAWSAIVSSDHQIPVLINGVQVFQVAGGCPRGLDRITTFVNKTVAFQSVHLSGSQHELPQTGSAYTGSGRRVQRRFNDRQVSEFKR